jgi:hypothetical protein
MPSSATEQPLHASFTINTNTSTRPDPLTRLSASYPPPYTTYTATTTSTTSGLAKTLSAKPAHKKEEREKKKDKKDKKDDVFVDIPLGDDNDAAAADADWVCVSKEPEEWVKVEKKEIALPRLLREAREEEEAAKMKETKESEEEKNKT